LTTLTFSGAVASGQGNGKRYLELDWVKQQIKEKLGYTAYPGTLNIVLTKESVTQKQQLKKAQTIHIYPAAGYCFGSVYKASLKGIECAIVVPEVEGYPENILEIIAPMYLRKALSLKDGDTVRVTVKSEV